MTISDDGKALAAVRARVETAISAYTEDVMDCSAGYAVIRYARLGLMASDDPEVEDRLRQASYSPEDPEASPYTGQALFGILRDARAGALRFAEPGPEPETVLEPGF